MNTYIHSGSYGDMIFGLPAVIASGGGVYYLREDMAPSIKQLIEAQPYIRKVEVVSDSEWRRIKASGEITHDLDKFRDTQELHVTRMHLKAFNLEFDLKKPYLFNIPPNRVARCVVQDTGRQRFPGHTVNWQELKKVEKECVFMGNDADYKIFQEDRPYLNIPRHVVPNIYEFARVIAGCDLFVGNMSIGQTIAEGLKKPYVVDLYVGRPQYPLTQDYAYVGLCDPIFYWHLDRLYDGIPYPRKQGVWS